MSTPLLIYDGDCGFCTRSARFIERLPVSVVLLPWQEADLTSLRISTTRARHEVLWVAESGRVLGGAAAITELLKNCRFPWRAAGFAFALPLVRVLVDWTYRWVAAHRSRLPGTTPACHLPPEQRPGARRSG